LRVTRAGTGAGGVAGAFRATGAGVGRGAAGALRTTTSAAALFTGRAAFFTGAAAFFTGVAAAAFRAAGRLADERRATVLLADRVATVRFALARADECELRALAWRLTALRAARRGGLTTDFARFFSVLFVLFDFFDFAGLVARFGVPAFRPPVRLVFALAMTLLARTPPSWARRR